jgi:hypothetical protein
MSKQSNIIYICYRYVSERRVGGAQESACTAMDVRRRWPLNRPGGALGRPATQMTTQPTNRSVSSSMRMRTPHDRARLRSWRTLRHSVWCALRHRLRSAAASRSVLSRQQPGGRRDDAARPRSDGSQAAGRKQGAHWPVLTASGPALAIRWSGSGAARSSSGASGPLLTSASLGGPWRRARGQVRAWRAACSCQAWTRDSRRTPGLRARNMHRHRAPRDSLVDRPQSCSRAFTYMHVA